MMHSFFHSLFHSFIHSFVPWRWGMMEINHEDGRRRKKKGGAGERGCHDGDIQSENVENAQQWINLACIHSHFSMRGVIECNMYYQCLECRGPNGGAPMTVPISVETNPSRDLVKRDSNTHTRNVRALKPVHTRAHAHARYRRSAMYTTCLSLFLFHPITV